MAPRSILHSKKLSATAKIVMFGMAMESKGAGEVAISNGALAITCGCSRPSVIAALKNLEAAELIRKKGAPIDQVQAYSLLHPRYAVRQKAMLPLPADSKPAKPKVIFRFRCPSCSRMRPSLLRVGWCRSCNNQKRIREVVREEINKSA